MKKKLLLTVLLPFSLGYFLTGIFRVINAIQAPFLVRALHLNSVDLGFLTSCYLLAFAIAQLPMGLMLDKIGPRLTQSTLFFVAAAGTWLFSVAESSLTLSFARFIIGIGLAGGFMAAVKANAQWFPKKLFSMNGIVLAAGGIGALMSTTPSHIFIRHFGWRALNTMLAILLLFVALLILVLSPKDTEHKSNEHFTELLQAVGEIFKSGFFWQHSLSVIFLTSTVIGLQGLWAGAFLSTVNHLPELTVANILAGVAVAFILGALFLGYFASWAKTHHFPLDKLLLITIFLTLIMQLLILFRVDYNHYLSWFLYGLLAQGGALIFALLSQHFSTTQAGRAITAYNMLLFFAAFLIQLLFGVSVHYLMNAFHLSGVHAYQITFGLLVALQLIGVIPLLAQVYGVKS